MHREPPRGAALAFVVVLASAAVAQKSEPAGALDPRDDPSVWGYGSIGGPYDGSSKRAMPPAIVPTTWLVVPRASKADEEQVLTRFALESDAPLPTATKRASDASGSGERSSTAKDAPPVEWLAVESQEPKDALVAFTTITSESDDVRMAQLTGAELLFVNGEGFAGDVERLGFRGVPVLLKKGANRVFVAGIRGSFTLELWKPATRMVIGTWDAAWPGYGGEEDTEVTYPLFNAAMQPASKLHVHYGAGRLMGGDCRLHLTDWRDGGYLPPLGLRMSSNYWWFAMPCSAPEGTFLEAGPVCVYDDDDPDADRQVLRRDLRAPSDTTDPFTPRDAERPAKYWKPKSIYEPLLLVYGTRGSAEEENALLAQARFDQEFAWTRTRGIPLVMPDDVFLNERGSNANTSTARAARELRCIVYGNADTNSAWSSVVPAELGLDVRRTGLTRGATKLEGAELFGWFLCAKDAHQHAGPNAVVFSTGASGARAGSLLHPFVHGIVPLDDALYRRDTSAPQGRRALEFPRQ